MKNKLHAEDYDLQTLLVLDGQIYFIDKGRYWTKLTAYRVKPTEQIPHGIHYSLTLHESRDNTRIIGYDNAHSVSKTKKYKAKKTTWDHIHKTHRVYPYEFESASQLLVDFWKSVYEFIGKER